MRIGSLSEGAFIRQIRFDGLPLRLGPFNFRIRVDNPSVAAIAHPLYSLFALAPADGLFDTHIHLARPRGIRRWLKPQGHFLVDGRCALRPHAVRHGFPSLEWGINWCIATRAHHFLMLHAAVVERRGFAMLFPAAPGFGKSTLCTALVHSGWRLLSDEFGLVRPGDGKLVPIPRLIPLKNESIAVIRDFSPGAVMGPPFEGTHKGTVAHVQPPAESIARSDETAPARWLVFPHWAPGAPLRLEPIPKGQAFMMVAVNAFNYQVLGERAFHLVAEMIERCECYGLTYSKLESAIVHLTELTDAGHG